MSLSFRSPRRRQAGRIAALFLGCAVGFMLTASGVRLVLDEVGLNLPGDQMSRSLFDNYVSKPRAAARQRADLLFVGPSHIEMGVNPAVFDEALAPYARLRSYNMGVGSLGVPELEFVLDKRFAADRCCVKYVVLYPGFMLTDIARGHMTLQAIDYFSLSNAFRYWSYLRGYQRTPDPQLDLMQYAKNIIVAALQHQANLGLGLRPLGVSVNAYNPGDDRGHLGTNITMPESEEKNWLAAVAELETAGPKFDKELLSDGMFDRAVDAIDMVERRGARVIVVRPPSPWHWPYDAAFVRKFNQQCHDGPPLLDFGDPAEYPELYERQNRYDAGHLNGRGAQVWSRLLADRIGKLIQNGRLAKPAFCKRAKE